jgi:hypothetical protein
LQDSRCCGEQPSKIMQDEAGKKSDEQAWNRLILRVSVCNGYFSEWLRETKYNRNC